MTDTTEATLRDAEIREGSDDLHEFSMAKENGVSADDFYEAYALGYEQAAFESAAKRLPSTVVPEVEHKRLKQYEATLNYLKVQAKNGTLHPQVVIQNVDFAVGKDYAK